MKKIMIGVLGILLGSSLAWGLESQETAESIIRQVDDNHVFQTEEFKATMVISRGAKQKFTKRFFGYGQNKGKRSFMEFTNPEDRGVKYLKMEDELWIYFPDADDVMKISGHMLRQGMMGSDLSYEDMLESDKLEEDYACRRLADKRVDDRDCFVVELEAKKPDLAYAKQILYIDQERFFPLELERYARGGRLLKTMTQTDIRRIGSRWVPMKVIIQDLRKKDSKTTVQFEEIHFNKPLPENIFSKEKLKR